MISISYDRRNYQEDMIRYIESFDNVVELGCHVGTSTKIISKLCQDATVYAFDNSPESVEAMDNLGIEYSNIKFKCADVRDKDMLYEFAKSHKDIDVLCIDLGGGYHPDTVFKVFFLWSSILKPRVCLLRNRGLVDFINSSQTGERIHSDNGFLSSCADDIIPKELK
ncbi:MAG: SAM-dependent methyltransferase [Methanosphaera sp. rholeuAM130]|nr:MAG: SAM-dependent methyltransferase [Methanosphaera sp. rholeuAM130]